MAYWKSNQFPETHYSPKDLDVVFFAEDIDWEKDSFRIVSSELECRKGETAEAPFEIKPGSGCFFSESGHVCFLHSDVSLSSGFHTHLIKVNSTGETFVSMVRDGSKRFVVLRGEIPAGSAYYINEKGEVLTATLRVGYVVIK